jgi:asparagine synthase (glutamine-hydrolysing)
MCGIAGLLNLDLSDLRIDSSLLKNVSDSIKHRGPDGEGFFLDGEIALIHRRLSIIDLTESGNQPFYSEDKRFVIIFNGEIFNYLELRNDLEKKGEVFHTKSDTEVLLRLYIKYGKDCLDKLNGMFAFAVWDKSNKKLFIARDRIGIKPLYYCINNNNFYFGSEPKALFAFGVHKGFDEDILDELILFKYVAGENTCFKNVKRLLPGHLMEIENGHISFSRWWNLPDKVMLNRESIPKNPYEWFEEIFYSSVAYRTISDVPVGVMLSGGLDSGSIAAALHHNGATNVSAFTVGFQEQEYDESILAELVCKKFGLNFNLITLNGDNLYEAIIDATILHDEPLIHQNDAQMLALSRQAKSKVTVLLSGEGGDEFMGGYVRYKPLKYPSVLNIAGKITGILKGLNSKQIVNRFDKLNRYVSGNTLEEMVLLNASNIYPSDFEKIGINIEMDKFQYRFNVIKEAQKIYPTDAARQAMYSDLYIHMASVLDRNDRMTMGAGIECRVPFMDYRLMEMIPALPTNILLKGKKGKKLLYNSVAQKLPEKVLSFKKLGFSVPWDSYVESDSRFSKISNDIKNGSLDNFIGKFKPITKLDLVNNKTEFMKATSRQLMMLEIWRKNYLEK